MILELFKSILNESKHQVITAFRWVGVVIVARVRFLLVTKCNLLPLFCLFTNLPVGDQNSSYTIVLSRLIAIYQKHISQIYYVLFSSNVDMTGVKEGETFWSFIFPITLHSTFFHRRTLYQLFAPGHTCVSSRDIICIKTRQAPQNSN